MNILIKRRQLILATLIVALGAAVFVNWYYTGNNSTVKPTEETTNTEYVQNLGEAKYVNASGEAADYFSEVKLNRQKSRDEALDKLKDSLKSVKAGSEEGKKLTESVEVLSSQIKLESDVEALISAKLGCECVAVINESNAQIVVTRDSLKADSVLQIMDIITTNTNLPAEKIKITEAD